MDPKLFRTKLEELAELKQMKVPRSAGRAEATHPEIIQREGQCFSIDLHDNPTIAWDIKQLKNQHRVCEDCDNVVKNRVVNYKVLEHPIRHWRKSCASCQKTFNPESGNYDLPAVKACNFYNSFFNKQETSISQPLFKKPTK